jgi:hypothetical protein
MFILGSFSSFNFGKLSQIEEKTKIKIESSTLNEVKSIKKEKIEESITPSNKSNIFASKSGKKYYYVWCASASRVKIENRVYYATKAEAEKSGKTLKCPKK